MRTPPPALGHETIAREQIFGRTDRWLLGIGVARGEPGEKLRQASVRMLPSRVADAGRDYVVDPMRRDVGCATLIS